MSLYRLNQKPIDPETVQSAEIGKGWGAIHNKEQTIRNFYALNIGI